MQEPGDLISFTKQMDLCWLERRFNDLVSYIAPDVMMVSPGGKRRLEGLDLAMESYREFMERSEVHRFDTRDHVVTQRDSTAVVEYNWDIAWTDLGTRHESTGHEILVLSHRREGWRVIWRAQFAG